MRGSVVRYVLVSAESHVLLLLSFIYVLRGGGGLHRMMCMQGTVVAGKKSRAHTPQHKTRTPHHTTQHNICSCHCLLMQFFLLAAACWQCGCGVAA